MVIQPATWWSDPCAITKFEKLRRLANHEHDFSFVWPLAINGK